MKIRQLSYLIGFSAVLLLAAAPTPPPPREEPPDPATIANDPFTGTASPDAVVKDILVKVECFSMPSRVKARRAFMSNPDAKAMHHWLVTKMEDPKSEIKLAHFSCRRVRPGTRTDVLSFEAVPSPTDSEPAGLPQAVAEALPAAAQQSKDETILDANLAVATRQIVLPSLPAAFEFRHTGWEIYFDPTLSEDHEVAELTLSIDRTHFLKNVHYGPAGEPDQAIYQVQTIQTSIACRIDEPYLVGTFNPCPEVGLEDESCKDAVWFLFVTVSLQ